VAFVRDDRQLNRCAPLLRGFDGCPCRFKREERIEHGEKHPARRKVVGMALGIGESRDASCARDQRGLERCETRRGDRAHRVPHEQHARSIERNRLRDLVEKSVQYVGTHAEWNGWRADDGNPP